MRALAEEECLVKLVVDVVVYTVVEKMVVKMSFGREEERRWW